MEMEEELAKAQAEHEAKAQAEHEAKIAHIRAKLADLEKEKEKLDKAQRKLDKAQRNLDKKQKMRDNWRARRNCRALRATSNVTDSHVRVADIDAKVWPEYFCRYEKWNDERGASDYVVFFVPCGDIWALWVGNDIPFEQSVHLQDGTQDGTHTIPNIAGAKGWWDEEWEFYQGLVVQKPYPTRAANTAFMCAAIAEQVGKGEGFYENITLG
ncbi:hypothetical protein B0H63DRAFT_529763 [Podospora didyma]|uniref:Uncharacterized protein n=1 Tax=Podospora didyma TaxID=330526 RepID=A0AAE0JXX9_9PEZI|nr:hypothetical protein B0H63DRAFT_529763 [Podospora didyma]